MPQETSSKKEKVVAEETTLPAEPTMTPEEVLKKVEEKKLAQTQTTLPQPPIYTVEEVVDRLALSENDKEVIHRLYKNQNLRLTKDGWKAELVKNFKFHL